MTTKLTELTPQQQVFVAEYAKDRNGKRAAIRAGYAERTAEQQASRLLRNVKVKAAVDAALRKVVGRAEVTAERVVREIACLAFSDVTDIVTGGDGATLYVKDLASLPKHVRRCIAEVSETQTAEGGGQLKVKLHSKPTALRMLMDYLGMDAPKRTEHSGPGGGPVQVSATPPTDAEAIEMLGAAIAKDPALADVMRKKLGGGR